jgi:hypothetical protein
VVQRKLHRQRACAWLSRGSRGRQTERRAYYDEEERNVSAVADVIVVADIIIAVQTINHSDLDGRRCF